MSTGCGTWNISSEASAGSIEATSEQSAEQMVTELTTLPSQAGHTFHIIITYLIVNTYKPRFHLRCFKIEGFNDWFVIILYTFFATEL